VVTRAPQFHDDRNGMTGDQVSIRLLNDVWPGGESVGFERGSELLVHTTTATALVLSGAAIQLPLRLIP
jgi:hypothetical protein